MMTSNLGAELIKRDTSLGFAVKRDEMKTQEDVYNKMKGKVTQELQKAFRPEFLNRIDATVVFHALHKEHIREIVDLELKNITKQVLDKNMTLEVTEAAKDFLGVKGYDEAYGARPLRRLIQDTVEDKLSEALLEGRFSPNDTIIVDLADDEIILRQTEVAATPA